LFNSSGCKEIPDSCKIFLHVSRLLFDFVTNLLDLQLGLPDAGFIMRPEYVVEVKIGNYFLLELI